MAAVWPRPGNPRRSLSPPDQEYSCSVVIIRAVMPRRPRPSWSAPRPRRTFPPRLCNSLKSDHAIVLSPIHGAYRQSSGMAFSLPRHVSGVSSLPPHRARRSDVAASGGAGCELAASCCDSYRLAWARKAAPNVDPNPRLKTPESAGPDAMLRTKERPRRCAKNP